MQIKLQGLQLTKNGKKLLNNITFESDSPELICLVGSNGAGKTTLLRAIAGLEPYEGGMLLNNSDSSKIEHSERAQLLAWVPDACHIPFSYTVLDTVILGRFPWHQGSPQKIDFDKAHVALEKLGIADFALRHVTTLSAGELQKAMIARALASDAKIILLDEPCANLDINAGIKLMKMLRTLADSGMTVVISIHDINLGQRFANRILCLKTGEIIGDGAPEEILSTELIKSGFDADSEWIKSSDGSRHIVIY